MSIYLGKIYVGNTLFLDGNGVANAIGSELDSATSYTDIINAIVADKIVLADALNAFGVVANPGESLIDLINKTIPLSVNFIVVPQPEFFLYPVTGSITNTPSDVITFLATEFVDSTSDTFPDNTPATVEPTGDVFLGGDADNTTRSKHFVVVDVNPTTSILTVDSTSGMFAGDTVVQGIYTTTIVLGGVLDGSHLVVADTTGWVASSLVASF